MTAQHQAATALQMLLDELTNRDLPIEHDCDVECSFCAAINAAENAKARIEAEQEVPSAGDYLNRLPSITDPSTITALQSMSTSTEGPNMASEEMREMAFALKKLLEVHGVNCVCTSAELSRQALARYEQTTPAADLTAEVERLREACKLSEGLIAHSPGCNERYYGRDQTCNCGFYDTKSKLRAALSPQTPGKGE